MENFQISPPNYTQMPNVLLDKWLSILGHAELLVILFIYRKTFGYHKVKDQISLSQIESATGLARQHVIKAANHLEKKKLIKKSVSGKKGSQRTVYEILMIEEPGMTTKKKASNVKLLPPSNVKLPTKEKNINKERKQQKEKKYVVVDFLKKIKKEWLQNGGTNDIFDEAAKIFKAKNINTISSKKKWFQGICKKLTAKNEEHKKMIIINKKWILGYCKERERKGSIGILRFDDDRCWDEKTNYHWWLKDPELEKKVRNFYKNFR